MSDSTFPNNLPTLRSALRLKSPTGNGMCFHWSVAMCIDLPGSEVVIATFRAATPEERKDIPNASDVPFLHAFVEWQGQVFAPTTLARTGGQFAAMNPAEYYAKNGATNVRRVSRRTIRKHVADGFVMQQLLGGPSPQAPTGYLVERLLKAAGVKYLVTRDGGVVPA
jgi:hypothetical protein